MQNITKLLTLALTVGCLAAKTNGASITAEILSGGVPVSLSASSPLDWTWEPPPTIDADGYWYMTESVTITGGDSVRYSGCFEASGLGGIAFWIDVDVGTVDLYIDRDSNPDPIDWTYDGYGGGGWNSDTLTGLHHFEFIFTPVNPGASSEIWLFMSPEFSPADCQATPDGGITLILLGSSLGLISGLRRFIRA